MHSWQNYHANEREQRHKQDNERVFDGFMAILIMLVYLFDVLDRIQYVRFVSMIQISTSQRRINQYLPDKKSPSKMLLRPTIFIKDITQ